MVNNELTKVAHLDLSVGHALVVWDVLANKLSGSDSFEGLNADEKRALWALQDQLEKQLIANDIVARPDSEWSLLVLKAQKHVRTIPVEHLD
jgi:hypothetical protein